MAKNQLSAGERKAIDLFGKYYGRFNTWLYQRTGGRLGNTLLGAPVLLLTTIGNKSGQKRTVPLLYLKDGERYLIVASKGGYPTDPAWYKNLVANPAVEVQEGAVVKAMRARTVSEEEKAQYWPRLVAMYKYYQQYQDRTDRSIPVVALE
jgi:deazaflavin-dependent oxidoreductase (nitroreductase family)